MKKHTTLTVLLFFAYTILPAQHNNVENSESMVIMSEADIVSLAKTLRKYKKNRTVDISTNARSSNIVHKDVTKNETHTTFEADYLRSQMIQLENQISNLNNSQKDNVATVESYNSDLKERELRNLQYEMSQLKYAIQQLGNTPNDNLVIVTPGQNQASNLFQQPKEIIIKEQVPITNYNDLVLRQKLDSLNALFTNRKQTDNPNYTEDFDALQKRMDALRNDMLVKNTAPSHYDVLLTKYKGYNKEIYFADNSKVLTNESLQVVETLFALLDNNDNLDLVVKGFASNTGNAIYNENLSMQRTEAVKKALMIRGVHPTRVLTQYHGIDYHAQTANEARRVEVSILVRK